MEPDLLMITRNYSLKSSCNFCHSQLQSQEKRFVRCCEKFLPGSPWLLLSKTCKLVFSPPVNKKNLSFILFQNGDGFISAKELGVLMRTLGRNPTEDEIMNIMNEIDVDHNGKLDFSEFTVMMKDKLTQEDLELEIKQAFRSIFELAMSLQPIK